MGQTRKQRIRRKYDYSRNRKKEWKKSKRLPQIKESAIQAAWKEGCTFRANMRSMGLVANPNDVIKIKSHNQVTEVGSLKEGPDGKMEVDTKKPIRPVNIHVREALEAHAKAPRKKTIAMSRYEAEIIGYYLTTYGDPDDPKVLASSKTEKSILIAMARDKRNYDQLTPKQIKRKILSFKRVPEYVEVYYNNGMES